MQYAIWKQNDVCLFAFLLTKFLALAILEQ